MIFAGFLIGLGSKIKIVADLPMISTDPVDLSDFVVNRPVYNQLKTSYPKLNKKSKT